MKKTIDFNLPNIADRMFAQPLMIHPQKLKSLLDVVVPRMGLNVPDSIMGAAQDDFLREPHDFGGDVTEPSIAIIPISGTLVQRGGYVGESGMTSYDAISEMFKSAMSNSMIEGVLFDISSGGGEVAGCFDLADEIFNARGQKPIMAISNESAYSAAYALASAADEIVVTRTAGVGSVGVVCVHADQSGYNEKIGLKLTPIYAGAKKVDFWPHEALSEDALKDAQASIDKTYDLFVDTVARNRGLSASDVRASEAGCFQGEGALEIGLADHVGTFEMAVDRLMTL
tara:strand:+ start:3321 stop:4175 length:855 start_codon:yes stop_codon:yes gene_type:complete